VPGAEGSPEPGVRQVCLHGYVACFVTGYVRRLARVLGEVSGNLGHTHSALDVDGCAFDLQGGRPGLPGYGFREVATFDQGVQVDVPAVRLWQAFDLIDPAQDRVFDYLQPTPPTKGGADVRDALGHVFAAWLRQGEPANGASVRHCGNAGRPFVLPHGSADRA